MREKNRSTSAGWTIVGFALVGLLCGLGCAGVFTWWWSAQPKSYVVYEGSYEPFEGLPPAGPDSPFVDLGEVHPWPELFVTLIGASLTIGTVAGIIAVSFGRIGRSP